jgi:hypothetical protein
MGIRLDAKDKDAQGLPVVTWEEDRNAFAPDGFGRARVSCFIRPDDNGVLQFVSVGSVRHGAFEEMRPWATLVSFARETAEQHYYTAADRAVLEVLTSKSKSGVGRLLATDGAQVMLANFADDKPSVPMHLNCAACAPVEVAVLHDRLTREFITRRPALLDEKCAGAFVWPEDQPFVAYSPPARPAAPRWLVHVTDLSILAMLGLIGLGLYYWLVAR